MYTFISSTFLSVHFINDTYIQINIVHKIPYFYALTILQRATPCNILISFLSLKCEVRKNWNWNGSGLPFERYYLQSGMVELELLYIQTWSAIGCNSVVFRNTKWSCQPYPPYFIKAKWCWNRIKRQYMSWATAQQNWWIYKCPDQQLIIFAVWSVFMQCFMLNRLWGCAGGSEFSVCIHVILYILLGPISYIK